MAAKKKSVVQVDLKVALTEEELQALQDKLETPRKPSKKQVKDHFTEVLREEVARLLEDFPPDEENGESYA